MNEPVAAAGAAQRSVLTAFLSYSRRRRAGVREVEALQHELQRRGLHAWRDVTDLELGDAFAAELRHAIREQADAFVACVTPQYLEPGIIWQVEVPEALARVKREPGFRVIPLLRGVTWRELADACKQHGVNNLGDFNGEQLGRRASRAELAAAQREIARHTLGAALRRRLATDRGYRPRLLLRTAVMDTRDADVDLDLDWSRDFAEGCPEAARWPDTLGAALTDLRQELAGAGGPRGAIQIQTHARLPAAIALGEALSGAGNFRLEVVHDGACWSADAVPAGAPPRLVTALTEHPGVPRVAVVDLSLARAVGGSIEEILHDLDPAPGIRVCITPAGGVSRTAVEDGPWAASAAREVGDILRQLYDQRGVRRVHLFVAAPPAWCVLLGHHLSAVGELVIYQFHPHTQRYVRACTLGPAWPG